MATAKRRINSTNRKRIGHEAIDIRLLDTPPGTAPRATAQLKLDGMGFPNDAAVAIEAYRSSSLMRFDCGTIASLQIPPIMILDEIDAGGNIQFRVKVVDRAETVGKLLGSASRIRPKSKDDGEGRRSLLPIRYDDLGAEIWRVSCDEDEPPALVLNFKATDLDRRIFDDHLIRGLLMPAAFRIVLQKLASLSAPEDDDEDDWKNEWRRFCEEELEIEESLWECPKEDKEKWIDQAVSTFASRALFLEKIRNAAEGKAA